MATQEITAAAAANLFDELAGHAQSVRRLFHELMVAPPESHDAICMAGAALAGQIGVTAGWSVRALGQIPQYGSDRVWMLSPSGQESVSSLESERGQTSFQALMAQIRTISDSTVSDGAGDSRNYGAMAELIADYLGGHVSSSVGGSRSDFLTELAHVLCEAADAQSAERSGLDSEHTATSKVTAGGAA